MKSPRRIIGRLQHPNIPQIYEVGLDEKGRPFYTMREPKGTTLRQILDVHESACLHSVAGVLAVEAKRTTDLSPSTMAQDQDTDILVKRA